MRSFRLYAPPERLREGHKSRHGKIPGCFSPYYGSTNAVIIRHQRDPDDPLHEADNALGNRHGMIPW